VLACRPEVLVLDEPTTGLDAAEQFRMMDLVERLNRAGHTIVIVTHSMEVAARYARRTILLKAGGILADGPTREIFSRGDLLAEASLEAPPCVSLGKRLGLSALTVEELASQLERRGTQ
jgi:energy-coupling factor transport system ATP-binding protein